ncbi:MAG: glycosyltransferase [Chitinophagaceae bacterium]|nr:glycosyltransferase [Chitinophagaceae bacterium]
MNPPLLSVVMPVFNCAPYLKEAVDSILLQDFKDFELILINDGSSDNSEQIIHSIQDPRIVYILNEQNMGLVFTLNKGIDAAKGRFIARMDGDDICTPGRFSKQVVYMQQHPETDLLAGVVELIDEQGKNTGFWDDDRKNISPKQIRRQLPHDNCIAHPTVVAKTEIFRKYRYNARQKNAEDYDLWLRMAADNVSIHKLEDILVRHRIVQNSFTRQRQQNVFFKNATTKRKFAFSAIGRGKINGFVLKTLFLSMIDFCKGVLKPAKK